MDKKRQNIIIWFITWASLLLLVLYSPLGSPDLYNPNSIYLSSQGVVFNRNSFLKGPNLFNNARNNNINIPSYTSPVTKRNGYAVNSNNSSRNDYSSPAIPNNSSTKSGNNNSGSSELSSLSGGGSKKSGNASTGLTAFQSDNLISTSTDLSSLNDNSITRQGGLGDAEPNGTADPGGDPLGAPIPIPDGWGFLLVLAGIYAVLKKFILK